MKISCLSKVLPCTVRFISEQSHCFVHISYVVSSPLTFPQKVTSPDPMDIRIANICLDPLTENKQYLCLCDNVSHVYMLVCYLMPFQKERISPTKKCLF